VGNLFSFNGRVGRQTFWLVSIGLYVVAFVGALVLGSIMGTDTTSTTEVDAGMAAGTVLAVVLFAIAWVIGLATQIKRWHDRGKSGWWVLIGLVPFIGGIWALIECGFLPGTPGPNQYGAQA
jgi:uncharacterized membrane protein YhaH (DUF805 family)